MTAENINSNAQLHLGKLGFELPDTEEQLFQINHLLIVNIQLVKDMYHDGWEEILAMGLHEFLRTFSEEKKRIEKAHHEHNWQQIDFLAHKMKGGCLYLGMQKLALACQYLERYIKAGHTEQLEKLYEQMIHTLEDTLCEANSWIEHHG